jgi:hypothetical protein
VTRWTLILVAAVVVGASSAAATPSFVVRGDTQIGALHTRGGILADAKKAFGSPSKVRKKNASQCTVTWRDLGLVISFLSLERRDPCNKGFLVLGTMTSGRWTTSAGLRIGGAATSARIHAAYPRATFHRNAGPSKGWWLVTRKYCELGGNAPYPGLLARASGGRISALVVQIGVCE